MYRAKRNAFPLLALAVMVGLAVVFALPVKGEAAGHQIYDVGEIGEELPEGSIMYYDTKMRLMRFEMDTDGDGKVDVWNFYDKGNLVKQWRDESRDGDPDLWLHVDRAGALFLVEQDADGNGEVDTREVYRKNALSRVEEDMDGNGTFETLHFYSGELVYHTEKDRNGDGIPDSWYDFDDQGNLTVEKLDENFDGKPDVTNYFEDNVAVKTEKSAVARRARRPKKKKGPAAGAVVPGQAPDEVIRELDWNFANRDSATDLLRLVPGLHADDNTAGGRANRIVLRGTNAGFGREVAAYYDGIPLNLPSSVAGHGYLDLNPLIPDTLEKVTFEKGPFDPHHGNMAAAGAIDFVPDRTSETGQVKAYGGLYMTFGGMAEVTATPQDQRLQFAAAGQSTAGYTDPGNALSLQGLSDIRIPMGEGLSYTFSTLHHYLDSNSQTWVPDDWVQDEEIDRFEAIDDTDGVKAQRHLLGLSVDYEQGGHDARVQGYYNHTSTQLWTNRTFYLRNIERGDQTEAEDLRDYMGLNAEYGYMLSTRSMSFFTAAGVQLREDVATSKLYASEEAHPWDILANYRFTESNAALYVLENARFSPVFALEAGLRYDQMIHTGTGNQDVFFINPDTGDPAVNRNMPRRVSSSENVLSPKLSLLVDPIEGLRLRLSAGQGFVTNSALVLMYDTDSDVDTIRSMELAFAYAVPGGIFAVEGAGFYSDRDKEKYMDPENGLVFDIDGSTRYGGDLGFRILPLSWMMFSADASYTLAQYDVEDDEDDTVPLVPEILASGMFTVKHPVGVTGSVGARFVGERPLSEDESLDSYFVLGAGAGFERERWGAVLRVENVLSAEYEETATYSASRPDPDGDPVTGLHYIPGRPIYGMLSAYWKFK